MLSFEENAANAKTNAVDEEKEPSDGEPSDVEEEERSDTSGQPSAIVYSSQGPLCQQQLLGGKDLKNPTADENKISQSSSQTDSVLLQVVWSQCITGVFYELYSDGEVRLKRLVSPTVLRGADEPDEDEGRDGAIYNHDTVTPAIIASPRALTTPPSTPTLSVHSGQTVGEVAPEGKNKLKSSLISEGSNGPNLSATNTQGGQSVMTLLKSVGPRGLHVLKASPCAPNDPHNPLVAMKVVSVSPYSDERMISSSLVGGESHPEGAGKSTRDELKCDILFFNTGECALVYHLLLISAAVQYACKVREAKKDALRGLQTRVTNEKNESCVDSGLDSPMLSIRSGGKGSFRSNSKLSALLDSAAATIPFPKELEEEIIVDQIPADLTQKMLTWIPNVAPQIHSGASLIVGNNQQVPNSAVVPHPIPPPSVDHVGLALYLSFNSGDPVEANGLPNIVGSVVASTGYGTISTFHLRAPLGVKRLYPRHLPQMIRAALNTKTSFSSLPSAVFGTPLVAVETDLAAKQLNLIALSKILPERSDSSNKDACALAAEQFFAISKLAAQKEMKSSGPLAASPPELPSAMFPLIRHLQIRTKSTSDHSIATDMSNREAHFMGMTGTKSIVRNDLEDCFVISYGTGPSTITFFMSLVPSSTKGNAPTLMLKEASFATEMLRVVPPHVSHHDLAPNWQRMSLRMQALVQQGTNGLLLPNVASITGALQLSWIAEDGIFLSVERQTTKTSNGNPSDREVGSSPLSSDSLMRVRCSLPQSKIESPLKVKNTTSYPQVLMHTPNIAGCIPARAANGRLTVYVATDGRLVALNEAIGILGRVPSSLIRLPIAGSSISHSKRTITSEPLPTGLIALSFSPEAKYLLAHNVLTGAVVVALARNLLNAQSLDFVGGEVVNLTEQTAGESATYDDNITAVFDAVENESRSPTAPTANHPLLPADARALAIAETIPSAIANRTLTLRAKSEHSDLKSANQLSVSKDTVSLVQDSHVRTIKRFSDSFYLLLFESSASKKNANDGQVSSSPSSVSLQDTNGCNALHCLICYMVAALDSSEGGSESANTELINTFKTQFCDYVSAGVSLVATARKGPLAGFSPLSLLGIDAVATPNTEDAQYNPIVKLRVEACSILEARFHVAKSHLGSIDLDLVTNREESPSMESPLHHGDNENASAYVKSIGSFEEGKEKYIITLHKSLPNDTNVFGQYSIVCEVSSTLTGAYAKKVVHEFEYDESFDNGTQPAVTIASVHCQEDSAGSDEQKSRTSNYLLTGDGCIIAMSTSTVGGSFGVKTYRCRVRSPSEGSFSSASVDLQKSISFSHYPVKDGDGNQWNCVVWASSAKTQLTNSVNFAFPCPTPKTHSKSDIANDLAVKLSSLFFIPKAVGNASFSRSCHSLCSQTLLVSSTCKNIYCASTIGGIEEISIPHLRDESSLFSVHSVVVDNHSVASSRRFAAIVLERTRTADDQHSTVALIALFDGLENRIVAITGLHEPLDSITATLTVNEDEQNVSFLDKRDSHMLLRTFNNLRSSGQPALSTLFVDGEYPLEARNSISLSKVSHRLARTVAIGGDSLVLKSISPVNL